MTPMNPLNPNARPSSSEPAGEESNIREYLPEQGTDPELLRAFEEMIAEGKPKIPEHVFVSAMLPLTYHEPGVEKDPFLWRRFTGGMSNGVRVINPRGEVLFETPGLFPEMPLFRDEKDRTLRWAAVQHDAILHNAVHPAAGTVRLVQMGMNFLPDIPEETRVAHQQAWEAIWARYGVAGKSADATAAQAAVPPPPSTAVEMEEEDEI